MLDTSAWDCSHYHISREHNMRKYKYTHPIHLINNMSSSALPTHWISMATNSPKQKHTMECQVRILFGHVLESFTKYRRVKSRRWLKPWLPEGSRTFGSAHITYYRTPRRFRCVHWEDRQRNPWQKATEQWPRPFNFSLLKIPSFWGHWILTWTFRQTTFSPASIHEQVVDLRAVNLIMSENGRRSTGP